MTLTAPGHAGRAAPARAGRLHAADRAADGAVDGAVDRAVDSAADRGRTPKGRQGPRAPLHLEPLVRVRALCMRYPQTQERPSHGEPAWFVSGRRMFLVSADHHHDDRTAFWAAAPDGAQRYLLADDPARYFRPPYVGARGWVGVWLDVLRPDWDRIEQLVDDAWRAVAGPRLVKGYDLHR